MPGDFTFRVVACDFQEMFPETFLEFTFGLRNILDSAPSTCNAVDQV